MKKFSVFLCLAVLSVLFSGCGERLTGTIDVTQKFSLKNSYGTLFEVSKGQHSVELTAGQGQKVEVTIESNGDKQTASFNLNEAFENINQDGQKIYSASEENGQPVSLEGIYKKSTDSGAEVRHAREECTYESSVRVCDRDNSRGSVRAIVAPVDYRSGHGGEGAGVGDRGHRDTGSLSRGTDCRYELVHRQGTRIVDYTPMQTTFGLDLKIKNLNQQTVGTLKTTNYKSYRDYSFQSECSPRFY